MSQRRDQPDHRRGQLHRRDDADRSARRNAGSARARRARRGAERGRAARAPRRRNRSRAAARRAPPFGQRIRSGGEEAARDQPEQRRRSRRARRANARESVKFGHGRALRRKCRRSHPAFAGRPRQRRRRSSARRRAPRAPRGRAARSKPCGRPRLDLDDGRSEASARRQALSASPCRPVSPIDFAQIDQPRRIVGAAAAVSVQQLLGPRPILALDRREGKRAGRVAGLGDRRGPAEAQAASERAERASKASVFIGQSPLDDRIAYASVTICASF